MAERRLRLRWAGTCATCGTSLPAGGTAWWNGDAKTAMCEPCHDPAAAAGVAGQSAAREHEKRAAKERERKERLIAADAAWRRQVKEDHPVLGRISAALTPAPRMTPESQATRAWATGAAGETRVGEVLATCEGAVALHDRRVPRSTANIDHIAVGPSGVFVIDAKKYVGKLEKRDKGTWLRPDIRLYVNGRDQTKLVDGLRRQVEVVRGALQEPLPVRGILCFVAAEWPGLFMRPIEVGGITAVWPLRLPEIVTAAGDLSSDEIRRVASRLASALPPA